MGRSQSASRPMTNGSAPRVMRRPSGRTSAPTRPPGPSLIEASTSRSPLRQPRVLDQLDLHRPEEVVAVGAGVLPGLLGELALEDVGVVVEALGVLGAEADEEVVGRDGPPDAERAPVVHLAQQLACDLDRLETAAEGFPEGAFHQPLEPTLEALDSHRRRVYGPNRPERGTPGAGSKGASAEVTGPGDRVPLVVGASRISFGHEAHARPSCALSAHTSSGGSTTSALSSATATLSATIDAEVAQQRQRRGRDHRDAGDRGERRRR